LQSICIGSSCLPQNIHLDWMSPINLYIWSGHYICKVGGWGLFDHQKPTVMRSYLSVVWGCFCWPFSLFVTFLLLVTFVNYFLLLKVHLLLLFVTFFTTCNFCKLFFIVEGGKVSCFNLFFDCSGGRGAPLFIYFDFFSCWGGGGGG
jgi:hypothetical protein